MSSRRAALALLVVAAACAPIQPRFPDDVQAAIAGTAMRRLETERFVVYYPAARRAEIDRFLAHLDRCAGALRAQMVLQTDPALAKMIVVMPDAPFNNAYVAPPQLGYEDVAVIPTYNTLDFATEFGLPPDPAYIACHELTHYVHEQQIDGTWAFLDRLFGHLYSPQNGFDPWFFEGLATHYEGALQPGVGRPTWPVFTGMFAAGYAGHHVGGGELSTLGRLASVGHHYLVGTMFVRFLVERYGEHPLWLAIADEARAVTGVVFTGAFKAGFGRSFDEALAEFDAWVAATYPVRLRPAGQRTLGELGNDARYARGRDGTEAWVADDVDLPTHLTVRDPRGQTVADLALVDVLPPRTVAIAAPLLVSGLSITADGREVYLTVVDLGATFQTTRLLRWRRDDGLVELAADLGPGATIDPRGATYYHAIVDGDRWSLGAYDLAHHRDRLVVDVAPGTYVLGAQLSADGARLAASVWDGDAFVVWLLDAATGARLAVLRDDVTPHAPLWDPAFLDDGRVVHLAVVAGRFQIVVRDRDGARPQVVSDAPYAILAPRGGPTLRFLNRDGWQWTLDELALPTTSPAPDAPVVAPSALPPPPLTPTPTIVADAPYARWDHLLTPSLRLPYLAISANQPVVGLVLGGGDRLGFHRWALSAYVQGRAPSVDPHLHVSGAVGYLDASLAPWLVLAGASQADLAETIAGTTPAQLVEHRARDASLAVGRTWRGALSLAVGAVATEDRQRFADPGVPAVLEVTRRLAGPSLALAWLSGVDTRYAGLQRALYATATAAHYPRALSTFAGAITDLDGRLTIALPLPVGRRHTLTATLRERALIARDDTGLLELGGDGGLLTTLWSRGATPAAPAFDDARFPPNLRFVEPLRGYEDHAITTDRATIAELAWRYPIIFDRGVATTLWLLPASYLRELDLELFGTAARDRAALLHAAVGATLTLRILALRLPIAVTYQLARRVRDDDALTQLVGLGADY
jgi:hypothetical protein